MGPKKWWQPLDGTIVTASDALFAANLWIQHPFATVLMTKFTAVFVMADFEAAIHPSPICSKSTMMYLLDLLWKLGSSKVKRETQIVVQNDGKVFEAEKM